MRNARRAALRASPFAGSILSTRIVTDACKPFSHQVSTQKWAGRHTGKPEPKAAFAFVGLKMQHESPSSAVRELVHDAALELVIAHIRAEVERAYADNNHQGARRAHERLRHAVLARSQAQIKRMECEKGLC